MPSTRECVRRPQSSLPFHTPAIGTARKVQSHVPEAPHDAIGGALAREQLKDRADGALHLLVGIEHDLVVVEDQPDRQWKPQLALGGFVELAAMEDLLRNQYGLPTCWMR